MSHSEFVHGNAFYRTVDALSDELASLFEAGDVESVLSRIQAFVRAVDSDRRAVAKIFADPVLDKWCQRIGATVAAQPGLSGLVQESERADCVILATELYRAGGHSAVIGDLVRTGRFGPRTVLLLTDTLETADPAIAAERFGSLVESEIAPAGSLVDKLRWTFMRLLALRPRRLILFNHHYDSVAVAAAQPGIADEVVFYHHGDHQLCLGVTLKHTLHVDPHAVGFHHCREAHGLTENVFWPLIVDDLGAPEPFTDRRAALRTCSSGSSNKFELDYKYKYVDLVPRLLACTGGTHVHIGPLSDAALGQLYAGLDALLVPRDRFVHVPWVQSVWRALQQQRIDVYLASFPLGGGRVAIEAMGAGIPMIVHSSYVSSFFGGQDMLYPKAFVWETPDQLLSHVGRIDSQQLKCESRLARAHYEQNHTASALARAIDAGSDAAPPPPLRPQRSDPMQSFLDDVHYALQDHLTAAEIAPIFEQLERDRVALATKAVEAEAISRTHSFETMVLIRAYTHEIAQLREEVTRLRAQEHRLALIERSRSWRLARLAQRAAAVLRG
ncbi:hypothetical protein [Paraburkholderia nemoris]|uniref:Glycosyltransferase n=1 Tax=Paraburkholderia nemoris TaxID=2793076 RepID=A0ABM8QKN2_9BURK|nr:MULTISPECIES: hypothetical protein [Paraburkholderia]MBK3808776.1 hypothetical protein [Paraburkholderia aspalathi]CAE6702428.1 hypothetical protein R69776_00698 [Paraburkholderia nemoris]CAE6725896.1 hypothetical protein R75777_01803 [Paraburkholderia nemoris]